MEMLIVRVGRLDHSTGIAFLIAGVTPPVAVTLLLMQSSSVFVSIRIRKYLYRFTPVSICIDFIFCSFIFLFRLGFFACGFPGFSTGGLDDMRERERESE